MLLKNVLIALGIIAVLKLLVFFWVATSLWLLWYGLPPGEQRVAISVKTIQQLDLTTALQGLVPDEASELLPHLTAFGVSQQGEETTLILLPRLTRQAVVRQELVEAGWTVTRRGLMLVAYQNSLPPTPWLTSAAATDFLSAITMSHYPLQPSLIFESQSMPYLGEPLSGVATFRSGSLRLLALAPGTSIASQPLPLQQHVSHQAVLQLPGEVLKRLPLQLTQRWNETLRTKLAFALTRPEFIEALSDAETVRISLAGEDVGIAVWQHPAFQKVTTEWLQTEERHTRLVQRAFRLPDGTLGYEKVPGEPQSVLQAQSGSPCQAPVTGKSTLWLCQQGGATALATSEAYALALLSDAQTHQVALGSGILQELTGSCSASAAVNWCRLRSLLFEQHEGRAAALVTFN